MEEVKEPIMLPNELIIKILKYAHPSVIIGISSSDDIYLKSFTFVPELLRELCFCKSGGLISVSNLREFLKSAKRRKEIAKLCVRGYETLGCVLFNTSVSWSRLRKLDISHCGVNVTGLFSILNHLEELEELSWSTFFPNNDEPQHYFPYPSLKRQKVESIFTDYEIKNLKTLNLEVVCANITNVLVLLILFKDITNLRIRVTHSLTRRCGNSCLSALDTVDLKSLEKSCENGEARFENLRQFSLTSDSHQRWGRNFPIITHVRCVCGTIHCFVKYKLRDPTVLDKILIVVQKELNLESDLDWITHPASLPLINVQAKEINNELVNWIKYHGGENLRSLSLSNCHSEFKKIQCLPLIFESCPNIEELNLDGYLDTDLNHLNCESLTKLSKLKALAVSDVLINRLERHQIASTSDLKPSSELETETQLFTHKRISPLAISENKDNNSKFKLNLLSSLENRLEELEIRSVINTNRSANLYDADLIPISMFSQLKRLTLSHLSGVIRGQFFWPIFSKCSELVSLRIYHLEFNNSGICQHQDAFVQALSLLNNLQTLCFHHNQLDLTKYNLWNSLGYLKQLKKLCLGTNKRDGIDLKPIGDFLDKAKKLEVFHIHSKSINFKKLEKCVKKHHCFANKPSAEIVIHDLMTVQNVVKVTEWGPFQSCVENKKNLCWGSSEIGYYESHSRCHHY